VEQIKTVEIQDKVFEETYTAHIQRNGTNWLGWFPEVPKVRCEEPTEAVLLKTLEKRLHEALVAEEEAWEKQFEEDVKAGRLDHLAEKAVKNYRDGKCRSIDELQKVPRIVFDFDGRILQSCLLLSLFSALSSVLVR
jgi:hypothetical protein